MEIGKWQETMLSGGFAEEWGYICPRCGCTVSDRSRVGFHYSKENQRLNYCPSCGTRLFGHSENNLPEIIAHRFIFDRKNRRIVCSVRLKFLGEDFGVSFATSLEALELQNYFCMEDTE